jgi:magnesium chelatase subunit I
VSWFQNGRAIDLSDELSDRDLEKKLAEITGLQALAKKYLGAKTTSELAAGMEFVLEGLHQSSLLAKHEIVGGRVFKDMFEEMVRGLKKPGDKPKPPRSKEK